MLRIAASCRAVVWAPAPLLTRCHGVCRVLVLRACAEGGVQAGPQHDWLAGRLLHAAAGDPELLPNFLDSVLREGFLPRKMPAEAAAQKWVAIWQAASEPERQALQVRHCCSQVTRNANCSLVEQYPYGFSKAFWAWVVDLSRLRVCRESQGRASCPSCHLLFNCMSSHSLYVCYLCTPPSGWSHPTSTLVLQGPDGPLPCAHMLLLETCSCRHWRRQGPGGAPAEPAVQQPISVLLL